MFLRVLSLVVVFASPLLAAERPLVIGHRGASGYLPEHTLESYARAIEQGADYIEPDLVITKDGVLIVRHEPVLNYTTDVAEKFPARKTTKTLEGSKIDGWFAEDFTLAEIKTLRAKERLPFRDHSNDGKFQIPTFDDVLALRAEESKQAGREIGIYPETKHPAYFIAIGLPLEERAVAALQKAGLNRAGAPVFLQSFEAASLKKLKTLTPLPLIQLLDGAVPDDAALAEIATYATGIGPTKTMIVPVDKDGKAGAANDLVARAHKAGLVVHPYTFRPERPFLPASYDGKPEAEYCQFATLGVDGLFTDTPDLALKAFRESCPMAGMRK